MSDLITLLCALQLFLPDNFETFALFTVLILFINKVQENDKLIRDFRNFRTASAMEVSALKTTLKDEITARKNRDRQVDTGMAAVKRSDETLRKEFGDSKDEAKILKSNVEEVQKKMPPGLTVSKDDFEQHCKISTKNSLFLASQIEKVKQSRTARIPKKLLRKYSIVSKAQMAKLEIKCKKLRKMVRTQTVSRDETRALCKQASNRLDTLNDRFENLRDKVIGDDWRLESSNWMISTADSLKVLMEQCQAVTDLASIEDVLRAIKAQTDDRGRSSRKRVKMEGEPLSVDRFNMRLLTALNMRGGNEDDDAGRTAEAASPEAPKRGRQSRNRAKRTRGFEIEV